MFAIGAVGIFVIVSFVAWIAGDTVPPDAGAFAALAAGAIGLPLAALLLAGRQAAKLDRQGQSPVSISRRT